MTKYRDLQPGDVVPIIGDLVTATVVSVGEPFASPSIDGLTLVRVDWQPTDRSEPEDICVNADLEIEVRQ